MWLEDQFGSDSMLQRNERVKLPASYTKNGRRRQEAETHTPVTQILYTETKHRGEMPRCRPVLSGVRVSTDGDRTGWLGM